MNVLWKAGQASPNPSGRPKGSKRTFKTTIDRFFRLNITLKELQNIYSHLNPGKEQVDFLKALLPYHITPLQSDGLSETDIDALYDKLEQSLKREAQQQKAG
jgi:hypothetical protein